MHEENVIVIGGITGGIGSAIAEKLATSGSKIIGFSHSKDKINDFAQKHSNFHIETVDATNSQQVDDFFKKTYDTFGKIDGYVHAIGSFLIKSIHLIKDDEWQKTIDTNLTSAFYCMRAVLTHMHRQRSGSMVFFSSVATKCGLPSHEAIAAAKAGINGLVISEAASDANKNIRVNAIAPGLVETPGTAFIHQNEAARKISKNLHPLGRFGKPQEIASLTEWLLSNQSSWVTGQIFSMDGGMSSLKVPK